MKFATYDDHLDVEVPEGLLIKLFQHLMSFDCTHYRIGTSSLRLCNSNEIAYELAKAFESSSELTAKSNLLSAPQTFFKS